MTGGAGNVTSISLGGGNDRFTAGTGFVRSLDMGSGNDIVTMLAANARVGDVSLGTGNDTVRLEGNARINSLTGEGNRKIITLRDNALIDQMTIFGGNKTITLSDNARVYQMKLDGGTNTVTTGSGFLESFFSFGATNTLTINGGAAQIAMFGPGETFFDHRITANGFIGSLQICDNARATVTLNAEGDYIRTSNGDDIVTANGGALVGTITTLGGDDIVTLGAGGAFYVHLGEGDDIIRIDEMDPTRAVRIEGAQGIDTLDLSRIDAPVFVDLTRIGNFQNIGAPNGDFALPGVFGYLSIEGIENLVGTRRNDTLIGRFEANRIEGGAGNDTLFGLEGNDTLVGGRGNDNLTGGADADLFVFAANDGTDRINDFELGLDAIQIAGVTGLAQITFTNILSGVRLEASGTTINVIGRTAAEMNDIDNFVF